MIKTRAGKHIQSLWVTDYTDSIIIKRFENNSNNSLEELKVIGKGGVWVKFEVKPVLIALHAKQL